MGELALRMRELKSGYQGSITVKISEERALVFKSSDGQLLRKAGISANLSIRQANSKRNLWYYYDRALRNQLRVKIFFR